MLRTAEIKTLRSIAGKTLEEKTGKDRVRSATIKDLRGGRCNQMETKAQKILAGPCRKNGPPKTSQDCAKRECSG